MEKCNCSSTEKPFQNFQKLGRQSKSDSKLDLLRVRVIQLVGDGERPLGCHVVLAPEQASVAFYVNEDGTECRSEDNRAHDHECGSILRRQLPERQAEANSADVAARANNSGDRSGGRRVDVRDNLRETEKRG
jgi:hypothetical protein